MAWRIAEYVIDGELDNTTRDWTTGWIRLLGRNEPLQLKLVGTCHPDLAGWRFQIVRITPSPDLDRSDGESVVADEVANRLDGLRRDQSGHIGDVTADQMLKEFACSTEEFIERSYAGDRPPTKLSKALYLEWFSNSNGRVVIQSTRLAVRRQGEREFELTDEEWAEQARQNSEEMTHFMHQLGDTLESHGRDGAKEKEDADEGYEDR